MANEKISQLPAGAPAQTTDQIPIARSGSNFFLTVSDIIAKFAAAFGFNAITTGVNTGQTLTVGNGSTLGPSGTGVVNANEVGGVTVSGTPSAGQSLIASSSSAASWQATLQVAGGGILKIQGGRASVNNGGSVTFPNAFTSLIALTIGNYGGSANIASSSASGFTMNTSSSPQQIDWIAVGT